ncbi:venom allergen 3-like [Atheta coriaria]|uniref:venom allergen 3-like n=1 Tax=Dalotia coriaria TaxID=877792 RepID=UPI0031F38C18
MELPRNASQVSLLVPAAAGSSNGVGRVSQRLLSVQPQPPPPNEPQFVQLPSSANYQPSRKREEARALQNLRRRVQQLRIVEANESLNRRSPPPRDQQSLDNRPNLLQKILSNRPVSMVLDLSECRTAWQDSDFITDSLCWHNVYRQRHTSPPLTMSPELCHLAQTWANHLAHTNRFYYRNDKDIGQNLFCRPDSGLQSDLTGQEVTIYWYSAVKQYDYGKEPDVLHANVNAGHFTQLIWASSRHFGIGRARSRSGKIVVVAHYAPIGNISGLFENNVLPPVLELEAAQQLQQLQNQRFLADGTDSETNSSTNQSQST